MLLVLVARHKILIALLGWQILTEVGCTELEDIELDQEIETIEVVVEVAPLQQSSIAMFG